jgi:hypothetical protein
MYPCSDRFLAAAQGKVDARVTARASLITGADSIPLRVLPGWTVTRSLDQAIRSRITLELVDDGGLLPDDPEALLTPFGAEFAFTAGFDYLDGTEELLPYGVYGVYDVDDVVQRGTTIRIAGSDRSRLLAEATQEDFYTVTVGVDFADAIRDLILDRIPDAQFEFAATGYPTSGAVILGGDPGSDPNADVQRLAAAVGCEVLPTRTGTWMLRPVPDTTVGDTTLTFGRGRYKATAVTRAWSRDPWYNGVVVTGDRAGATIVQATAFDLNPESPTYYYGRVKKAWREQSELAFSTGQAQTQANALLRQKLRRSERHTITTLPNPALELGDIAALDLPSARASTRQSVDAITLTDRSMTINGDALATGRRLVRAMQPGRSGARVLPVSYHWGTVVSAGGGTATITLGGRTITSVVHAAGLTPGPGDSVSVRLRGTEPFIENIAA